MRAVLLQSFVLQNIDVNNGHIKRQWFDEVCLVSVFLGKGFDPVDGAQRVKHLSRAVGTVFASVREDGETIAAGAGAFSHGWASVHGMRTAQNQRGKGLAGQVLASLAQVALARGFENVFLQVEETNTNAVALYRRAGFVTAWRYGYWRKTGKSD